MKDKNFESDTSIVMKKSVCRRFSSIEQLNCQYHKHYQKSSKKSVKFERTKNLIASYRCDEAENNHMNDDNENFDA